MSITEHTIIHIFTCSIFIQGKYCPTTCGVADYLTRYMPEVTRDLDSMLRDLEIAANLTQGTEEKIVYMKDSATSAQKSSPQGTLIILIILLSLVKHTSFIHIFFNVLFL